MRNGNGDNRIINWIKANPRWLLLHTLLLLNGLVNIDRLPLINHWLFDKSTTDEAASLYTKNEIDLRFGQILDSINLISNNTEEQSGNLDKLTAVVKNLAENQIRLQERQAGITKRVDKLEEKK